MMAIVLQNDHWDGQDNAGDDDDDDDDDDIWW